MKTLISRARAWLAPRRKAYIALIVAAVGSFALKHGVELSADQTAWITAALTAASVYLVPNS